MNVNSYFVRGGICALCVVLGGCGDEKASHDATETARGVASDNAVFSAQKYRANSNADWAIVPRGDSTQSRECPQGDGWASIDLVSPDKAKTIKLKCSTYSAGIGCLTADDFNARAQLSSQEGNCNDEVPYPLPKVAR